MTFQILCVLRGLCGKQIHFASPRLCVKVLGLSQKFEKICQDHEKRLLLDFHNQGTMVSDLKIDFHVWW